MTSDPPAASPPASPRSEAHGPALDRLLRAISEANQLILRESDPARLLDGLCRVVVEHAGFRMAWVGLVDEASREVRPAAVAGYDEGYVANVGVVLDGSERSRGPTGRAITERRTQVMEDTRSDPHFAPWREAALARGYRSSAVFPLFEKERPWGALSIYCGEPHGFGKGAIPLLEQLSANVAHALEAREAERQLRSASAYHRTLLETSLDPLVTISPDGKITDVNAATEAITGVPRERLVGTDFSDYFTEPERAREGYRRVLAEGEVRHYALTLRHASGRSADVLYNASLYRNERGEVQGIFAAARDVSDLKRMEAERTRLESQLRQAQKMEAVGRLAGGVAHDFNNLLTVIAGFTDLAGSLLPAGHAALQPLDEVREAARRATSLTRQLLAFSRKEVVSRRAVELNALVSGAESMLQRLIGEDIVLTTRLGADPSTVWTDRGQVEQVLLNLAVNARDAMPKGGRLTIETANGHLSGTPQGPPPRGGDAVVLSVTDTGCGMNDETLAHMFEPFFTTKGPGQGTGLGLATVYGVVKQSGGDIAVESAPGKGTTFRITFPLHAAEKVLPADATAEPASPAAEGAVLLVEDEDAVRRLMGRLLRAAGFDVVEACDGVEALRVYGEQRASIALVVTDVVMPAMDGTELVERLRASDPALKVLFVSGYTSDRLVGRGGLDETVPMLRKPFRPDELVTTVREVLARAPALGADTPVR